MEDQTILSKNNFERKSGRYFGLFIALLSIIYISAVFGDFRWVRIIAIIFGYSLSFILIVQGNIYSYFRESGYKKITISDFVILLTLLTVGALILNTTLLIPQVSEVAPQFLKDFSITAGVTVGSIALLLGLAFFIQSFFVKEGL